MNTLERLKELQERLAIAEAEIAAVREQLAKAEEPAHGGFFVKPEGRYLYVEDHGEISDAGWNNDRHHQHRHASGNCFTNDYAGKREAEWYRDTMWWRGANKGKPLPKKGDAVWFVRQGVIGSIGWQNGYYDLAALEAGIYFIDRADAERQLAQIKERMKVLGL